MCRRAGAGLPARKCRSLPHKSCRIARKEDAPGERGLKHLHCRASSVRGSTSGLVEGTLYQAACCRRPKWSQSCRPSAFSALRNVVYVMVRERDGRRQDANATGATRHDGWGTAVKWLIRRY